MPKLDFSEKRILIIDDQRPFLALLKGVLGSAGAKSIVATHSCESALTFCRKEKFDFIICDLHLGGNKKNGFEFLEEVRQRRLIHSTTVFMIVSADAQRPMVLGSLEKQPDEYVVKPFSQAQLVLRLDKAYQRKLALAPVYTEMFADNYPAAIKQCKNIIEGDSRYQEVCGRLLAELYWHCGQYQAAQQWLDSYAENTTRTWLTVAKAQTALYLQHYPQAIEQANLALKKNNLLVEALDILAQAWFELDNQVETEAAITRAIKMSPLSFERHLKACIYARKNGQLDKIIHYSQTIWECSKRSVHRDLSHLCSHIRSFLDVAEECQEERQRLRYQQEALYTLQRYRHAETLLRSDDEFDFDIFEALVKARIDFQNGKLFSAKQNMTLAQSNIQTRVESPPLTLLPDSIANLLDLGEFEDAESLNKILAKSSKILDDNTSARLQQATRKNAVQKESFQKYNREGIALYSEGKFDAAYEAFTSAQSFAPVNVGITLNLLQCSIRLLQKTKKPDSALLASSRKIYRQLANTTMLAKHQEKLNALSADMQEYL
jgi:CheY-like chemotaxis protein